MARKEWKDEDRFHEVSLVDGVAEYISALTYPALYCIPVFIAFGMILLPWPDWLTLTAVSIIFASVIPTIIFLRFMTKEERQELDISNRSARIIPMLLILPSYLSGAAVLYLLNAPIAIQILMVCYFINTLFVLLVTLFWKISIHAMGVSGPAAAFMFITGYFSIIPLILIVPVAWSRVRLRKHTLAQVLVGAFSGLVLTTIIFSRFLRI